MRNQRATILLLALLLGAMLVGAGLAARLNSLQRQASAVEQQRLRLEQQEQLRQQELDELDEQVDTLKDDLADARKLLRQLEQQVSTGTQLQQERDQLKLQLQQEQERVRQLQQQVENLESMNEINDQVLALRQLPPSTNLPRTMMTRAEYGSHVVSELAEGFTPEQERQYRAKLLALDMIKPDLNLREEIIKGQASSVLGFYDPGSDELFVISDRSRLGVEDRITYAHEYVHFLQDQAFGLDTIMRDGLSSDELLARQAIVEGDATYSMNLWSDQHLDEWDRFTYLGEQLDRTLSALNQTSISNPGAVVESIGHFPYTWGEYFIQILYQYDGGWAGVNRAYSNPPRSTAQILHPELYFAGVGPVAVSLPELSGSLGPGWQTLDNDVLGELYLRVYLEHQLSIDKAVVAAQGWRGDRMAVLEGPDGARALVIRLVMQDTDEAGELFDAYASYIRGRGASPTLDEPISKAWQLADRAAYLSQRGREVLILQGNTQSTLDVLKTSFPMF